MESDLGFMLRYSVKRNWMLNMKLAAVALSLSLVGAGSASACDFHWGPGMVDPYMANADPYMTRADRAAELAALEAQRQVLREQAMEEARLAFVSRFGDLTRKDRVEVAAASATPDAISQDKSRGHADQSNGAGASVR